MTLLRIERAVEWTNQNLTIGIYIDGEKVGTIYDGEFQEYKIAAGHHEMFTKYGIWRSPKINLDIPENETKTLKLSGFKYGDRVFEAILVIVIVWFLGRVALATNLNILIGLMAILFLYPLYFITFGKNKYFRLTEKENDTAL